MVIFMFGLLIVAIMPIFIVRLYQAARDDGNKPALLQEWAKANHMVILRKRRGLLPWRFRVGARYSPHRDSFAHLEVLDEATHRVRGVWLLLRSYMLLGDMTTDNIEVLGWDNDV